MRNETLTVAADGARLHVRVRGQGPPLVFVNGMSQTTANWMSQQRNFARAFTTIAFDGRGQGNSPLGNRPLSRDLLVQDLAAVLDGLGFDKAHICGFSYGGRIALAFAAQNPDRTEKLVLTGTGSSGDGLQTTVVRAWQNVLRLGGMEAMAWCSITHIFGSSFLARHQDHLDPMIRAAVERNDPRNLEALLAALDTFGDALETARAVSAPSLVLVGDADLLVPVSSARALADVLSAELGVIEDCGHTASIEAPQIWRDLVLGFLRPHD